MDPRQSVRPGDPIRLAAEQVNGLNRLLASSGGFPGGQSGDALRPYTWVYYKHGEYVPVENVGYQASILQRGSFVALNNVLLPPVTPAEGAWTQELEYEVPVFTGGDPRNYGSTKRLGAWGVAAEAIRGGRIGKVAVSGVVWARINVLHASHRFVAFNGTTTPAGDALIMWQEAGLGEGKWAAIRLGHDRGCVRVRFTAPWAKNTTRDVEDPATSSPTRTIPNVTNWYGNVGGTGSRLGAVAWMDDRWVLIAAEC